MNNFGTIFKFELAKIFKKRVTMITLLVIIVLNLLSWLNFLMGTESTRMVVEDDGKTVISKENTISGYERMVLLLVISFVAAVLESIFVAMLSECTNNGVVTMALILFVFFSVVFYYIGKRRYIHYEVDGR